MLDNQTSNYVIQNLNQEIIDIYPLNIAFKSFNMCKKNYDGLVSPKDYFKQLQLDIAGFDPDGFRDFCKKESYFQMVYIDGVKFLKLKEN